MSTLQEIEAAIRLLPAAQREQLVRDLPKLLPELDGDTAWEQIVRDARPRPAFTAMLNEVETDYRRDPAIFPEIQDRDFDRPA
jgi:hypothetical protein